LPVLHQANTYLGKQLAALMSTSLPPSKNIAHQILVVLLWLHEGCHASQQVLANLRQDPNAALNFIVAAFTGEPFFGLHMLLYEAA